MAFSNQTLVDAALILAGACISILFISTDGNGQNPIPIAGTMLIVVLVTGSVSFLLARLVRNRFFAIISSVLITDLLLILYVISDVAYSQTTDPHAAETISLLPLVLVVVTAPTVVLSSIGFVRLAHRVLYRRATPNIASE